MRDLTKKRGVSAGAALTAVLLAVVGCGRVEPKAHAEPKRAEAPPSKPAITPDSRLALPDYSALAKADVRREQTADLQTKIEQLKVELPAKKK